MIEIGLAVAAVACIVMMHKLLPATERGKENKMIKELKAVQKMYGVDEFHLIEQDGNPSYVIKDRYGKEFVVDIKYTNKLGTRFVLVDRYPAQDEIDRLKAEQKQTTMSQ